MKLISIDLSSNEECPIDFQISGGAREIKEITPHPQFLNLLFMVCLSWNFKAAKRPVCEEELG